MEIARSGIRRLVDVIEAERRNRVFSAEYRDFFGSGLPVRFVRAGRHQWTM